MAERRMFAKTIIDSDAFLEMPMSARLLYYDLGMRADDDGFVNSPKKIMKMIGATNDDINILIMRKFIIPFDNGIVVIKHWRINNYLRTDRYRETQYVEQKAMLTIDEKGKYHLGDSDVVPSGIPSGIPTVSTGKDRIGKDNLSISKDIDCQTEDPVRQLVKEWNLLSEYGISKVNRISSSATRYKMAKARISEYGLDEVIKTVQNVKNSDYLLGRVNDFIIDFDWFVRPNNFPKINEGKYLNRGARLPVDIDKEDDGFKDYE